MTDPKIYVLFNDISHSDQLAQYSAHLAKQLKMPATFISTVKVPLPSAPTAVVGVGLPNSGLLEEEELVNKIRPKLEDLTAKGSAIWDQINYDIEIGFPETRAIQKEKNEHPYLMVLKGQHDLTTLNEWFGTLETRIAQRTDCPALVVPPNYMWQKMNKILYMVDLNNAKVEHIRKLTNLAQMMDAALQVVAITDRNLEKGDGGFDRLISVFRDGLQFTNATFHRIRTERSAEEVARVVQTTAPDCLAFEQKNKSFFETLTDDYNTKRLILQSEIPVLVF